MFNAQTNTRPSQTLACKNRAHDWPVNKPWANSHVLAHTESLHRRVKQHAARSPYGKNNAHNT
eukprot:8116122-Lingulodinium_polyedra.AAC.1